jgi:hypothetical protein
MSKRDTTSPGMALPRRAAWQERLRELLATSGYASVGAFADSNPLASLDQLADALGIRDVTAVQLEGELLREAVDEPQVARRARDLLARKLATLPGGWPGPQSARSAEQETQCMQVLASWFPIGFASEYQVAIIKVALELLSEPTLPRGWRPKGASDPLLVKLFERHWRVY